MSFNIFLNKYKSKKGVKKTVSVPVDLEQEAKLFFHESQDGTLSQVDLYNTERQACTDIRLNVSVIPIVSNVLTNYKTEVVRYEGSDSAVSLTYSNVPNSDIDWKELQDCIAVKSWDDEEAVRNSLLTRSGLGFTYHYGTDFFSNYHFRVEPTNFKTVCPIVMSKTTNENKEDRTGFNTLFDYMREYNGANIQDVDEYNNSYVGYIHLFTAEEILEPVDAVSTFEREQDGWYGFDNISKLRSYINSSACTETHSPVASRSANDFIDLTPSRDLFTFYPKWNDYRRREEKNWNYCITYPCSATTDVEFIRQSTDSLKVAYFDEYSNNGYTYFATVCKHGLKEDDYVNIYKGDDIVYAKAKVLKLGSGTTDDIELNKDYVFAVKTIEPISDEWYTYDSKYDTIDKEKYPLLPLNDVKHTYGLGAYYTTDNKFFYDSTKEKKAQKPKPIYNPNFICAEIDTVDLSIKRVEGNMECDYYVRINQKVPNFKCASGIVDEMAIQNNENDVIGQYSMNKSDLFMNENGKLAFSKTIYSDDVASMTYTENIPFAYLLDEKNRPVSDFFFTIFKNNKGYKEWYNKDKAEESIKSADMEYSHVFGKLSCAFELSTFSEIWYEDEETPMYHSIHTINNIDSAFSGLSVSDLNGKYVGDTDESDEVNWERNRYFYNDLIEHSKYNSVDTSIQQCQFRFNTAQRELKDTNQAFSGISFDRILADDYDGGFSAGTDIYKEKYVFFNKEGYYYQPHYRIPVRTVSATKSKSESTVNYLRKDTRVSYSNANQALIFTNGDNYAELETKIIFYSSYYDTYFYGVVKEIKSTYSFECCLYKDYELTQPITGTELSNLIVRIQNAPNDYRYIKPNTTNPTYADFMKDGSFMFQWREIVPNGYDDNDVEVYPFVNSSLYIEKRIHFFLRRQWWDRLEDVNTDVFPAERTGKAVDTYDFDEYKEDDDINCLI